MLPVISLIAAGIVATAAPSTDSCIVDNGVYRLDIHTFDQDPIKGWRALADRPECRVAAAELMSRYRVYTEARLKGLIWHEGQVRAEAGEIAAAIDLMGRAKRKPFEHGASQEDWNAYVDATIAFLHGHRPALLQARTRLASFPWPKGHTYIDENGVTHTSRPANWPMNLDVVDRLISCFGHPYAEAYRNACASAPSTPAGEKATPRR